MVWYTKIKESLQNSSFTICINGVFESSHSLRKYNPDGSDEIVHGHTWKVNVYIASKNDGIMENGIAYDFLTSKKALNSACQYLDHNHINDLEEFKQINPTTENICIWFYSQLCDIVSQSSGKIKKIEIWEGPDNYAILEI